MGWWAGGLSPLPGLDRLEERPLQQELGGEEAPLRALELGADLPGRSLVPALGGRGVGEEATVYARYCGSPIVADVLPPRPLADPLAEKARQAHAKHRATLEWALSPTAIPPLDRHGRHPAGCRLCYPVVGPSPSPTLTGQRKPSDPSLGTVRPRSLPVPPVGDLLPV